MNFQPNGMRSRPGRASLPQERDQLAMEWAGITARLAPMLAPLGVQVTLEDHAASRVVAADHRGRLPARHRCPTNDDWKVAVFEGFTPDSVAHRLLVEAGCAEPDFYRADYLYYEHHMAEVCQFAHGLIKILERQGNTP